LNTLRLWLPQLFSSIIKNQQLAENVTTVCELLVTNSNATAKDGSLPTQVDGQVYINAVVVGLTTAAGYLVSGYLIKALGKKWLISEYVVVVEGQGGILA